MCAASIIDLLWKQRAFLCGLCAGSLYWLFNGDGARIHDEKAAVTLGIENKRSSKLVYWIKSLLLLVIRDIVMSVCLSDMLDKAMKRYYSKIFCCIWVFSCNLQWIRRFIWRIWEGELSFLVFSDE
ncbi:hypothetical protein BJX65DRAFT_282547 [Aspergillus insuetus]